MSELDPIATYKLHQFIINKFDHSMENVFDFYKAGLAEILSQVHFAGNKREVVIQIIEELKDDLTRYSDPKFIEKAMSGHKEKCI